jgi:23S rRNA (uracil1939-C5)-methyltransferase
MYRKYALGRIINFIHTSDKRVNIICPYYNNCGGCNFLHTTYSNEKNIKQKYLERSFNRKINYLEIENELFYRNKIVLHVNKGILGLYNDKTHKLREIDKCLLINEKINEFIPYLKSINLKFVSEIMIRCIQDKIMVNIKSSRITDDIRNINCDSLYINNKFIKGKEYLIDEINNYKFSIYPESFYQVNKEGMTNIYNKALEYIFNNKTLLDLYCGTGTIGIWLGDNYKEITGIEINKDSIKNANINKELNNLNNIKFICGDAKTAKGKYDTIVVDPPRNGLSNSVIKFLNNSNAKKIIYISCNPKTLKRDIDLLDNYDLINISSYSMFPRTKHLECVCMLERK